MCLTVSQRELEKYSLHSNMLKWRISSSRFFFNINKRKCLTFPPFKHHFHHMHSFNPPFSTIITSTVGIHRSLGYPTLVPTSPPGGDWDQVSGAAKVSWCHQKKPGDERRQVLREVISDWQYLSDWTLKFLTTSDASRWCHLDVSLSCEKWSNLAKWHLFFHIGRWKNNNN